MTNPSTRTSCPTARATHRPCAARAPKCWTEWTQQRECPFRPEGPALVGQLCPFCAFCPAIPANPEAACGAQEFPESGRGSVPARQGWAMVRIISRGRLWRAVNGWMHRSRGAWSRGQGLTFIVTSAAPSISAGLLSSAPHASARGFYRPRGIAKLRRARGNGQATAGARHGRPGTVTVTFARLALPEKSRLSTVIVYTRAD